MALVVNPAQWIGLATMVDGLGRFAVDLGGGQVQTFPVVASAFVPAGTVIAVVASHFASATDDLEFDQSGDATLSMADAGAAAPTQAGAVAGGGALGTPHQVVPDGGIPIVGGAGASTVGAAAVSMFQTWSVGVRLVLPASFGVTRPGAVQGLTGVTW